MKLILHNGKLIENVWREPLLPISEVTTLLFPLLHSLSPPSTPRQMFGFPQRSHFSETSFPLYEGFENEIKGNLKVFLYLEKKQC